MWPFFERRWILICDPDYRWSLVGTPNRKHLWVISRIRELDQDTLDRILLLARNRDYQTTAMVTRKQP